MPSLVARDEDKAEARITIQLRFGVGDDPLRLEGGDRPATFGGVFPLALVGLARSVGPCNPELGASLVIPDALDVDGCRPSCDKLDEMPDSPSPLEFVAELVLSPA
jgi:hypothetical protein